MKIGMKAEIYNALAALNRGFDMAGESLTILQQEGIITADYVQQQTEIAEEIRANINTLILNRLQIRESDDRDHFAMMRSATEARLRSS